jgi:hypothetical protein
MIINFDAELVLYCWRVFRFRSCVEGFIDDSTRKPFEEDTGSHGVYFKSRYSERRMSSIFGRARSGLSPRPNLASLAARRVEIG